jgi:hypothetical protein
MSSGNNAYVNGVRIYLASSESYTNDTIIEEVRSYIGRKIET